MKIKIPTLKLKSLFGHRFLASMLLGGLILLSSGSSLLAQTVIQGYKSDQPLQRGILVSALESDGAKIESLSDSNLARLKGVVVDANDTPVTLSSDGQQIFVATNGIYEVIVSNENGKIDTGSLISASSLAGIGMKATRTQDVIAGKAVGSFDGGGDSLGKGQTKDGKMVSFGRIKVDIAIGKNPTKEVTKKDNVPDALQKVARTVADKPVSSLRIYLALIVLLITSIVAATTLFSGVRSTVIAIGRNPLSKGYILRGLIQVLLVSLIIFLTGLFGVYLLIRL